MAIDRLHIAEARHAAVYDGTNSADLNAAISDFTIVSENAAGLTFTSNGTQYNVVPGGYVAWYQGAVTEAFQNEDDFTDVYSSALDVSAHVHDLTLTTGQPKPVPQS